MCVVYLYIYTYVYIYIYVYIYVYTHFSCFDHQVIHVWEVPRTPFEQPDEVECLDEVDSMEAGLLRRVAAEFLRV